MSPAARSIAFFGIYMLATGLVFVAAPPPELRLHDAGAPFEPIRLLGILTLVVGLYYLAAARTELEPFFRMTVFGRALACTLMVLLVMLDRSPPQLLVVGAGDLAGACWTAICLRRPRTT